MSLLVTLFGCETGAPAEYPPEHFPPKEPTPVAAPAVAPSPNGTRWASAMPDNVVAEVEGTRVVLAAGERCKKYRSLPGLQFAKDTLVKDACIELPDNAVIAVMDGATLAIVATNGLRIGRNVVFRAKGHSGNRGARGRFATVAYTPATDREIQALCSNGADACACPSDEATLSVLRGQGGSNGSAGGSLRLLAAELVSPSNLTGFRVDVSGGDAGPPGESGVRECTRGSVSCASAACAGDVPIASAGADGRVVVSFSGEKGEAFADAVRAAVTPANVSSELARASTLVEQTATIDAEALQKGWQRRSGEDPY